MGGVLAVGRVEFVGKTVVKTGEEAVRFLQRRRRGDGCS